MSVESTTVAPRSQWMIHDVIIGLLAGAGVGSLIGVFISVRWFDNNLVTVASTLVGIVVGVIALLRSHQRHGRFLTTTVIVSWVLVVASGSLITALALAIANFN